MLIIMGDLLQVPVGTLFMAAWGPGLVLVVMYLTYIGFYAKINPEAAPKIQDEQIESVSKGELFQLVLRGFLPPVALIFMVKGSILLALQHQVKQVQLEHSEHSCWPLPKEECHGKN